MGSRKKEEGLPDVYQRVEYIENTGTQYILTNYIPTVTEDMKIEIDYMFTAIQAGDSFLFGAKQNGTEFITFQCESYSGSNWYCGSGIRQFRSVLRAIGITLNVLYSLVMNGNTLTVDGKSVSYNGDRRSGFSTQICIFAGNWNGAIRYINKGARIYKLTFTANDTKEADFVPCYRKSDGEIGMYDTVSRTFYTNAGTGTFLKGVDV